MLHRLFFAINIPDDIRLELVKRQERWHRYPVRWAKPENLHCTMLFLGNVDDERLATLQEVAGATLPNFRWFTIRLTGIILGPPERLPNMVWVMGITDPETAGEDLTTELLRIARAAHLAPPNADRHFELHLTLGRAKGPHLKGAPITAKLEMAFAASRLDLMESTLREDGPRYRVVASYNFSNALMH